MSLTPTPPVIPRTSLIIADDHAIIRDGLAALLRPNRRWDIRGLASTGTQALDLIRQHRPDIALLDHGMPEITGVEVVRRVREEDLPVRVVILSSFADPLFVADAMEAGVDGYMLKDDAFAELESGLDLVLAGECHISRSISRAALREALNTRPLTPRERVVLVALAEAKSLPQIARGLGISPRTAETHRNNLVAKFGAVNAVDLVRRAIQAGFVTSAHPGAGGTHAGD